MTVSPRPLLTEIAAGHSGAPIPPAKLAYIQQRLRNRMFNLLLEKFLEGQKTGLTKAALARKSARRQISSIVGSARQVILLLILSATS